MPFPEDVLDERTRKAVELLRGATETDEDRRYDSLSIAWLDGDGKMIGSGYFGNPTVATSPRSRARVEGVGEFDGVEADILARHLGLFKKN